MTSIDTGLEPSSATVGAPTALHSVIQPQCSLAVQLRRVTGSVVEANTDAGLMGRTRSGMDVIGIRRRYEVLADRMTYRIDMATERTPMALHLEGELQRTERPDPKRYVGESGEAAPVG